MPIWPTPKPAIETARLILRAADPTLTVVSDQPKTRPAKYVVLGLVTADYPNPAFTEPRILVDCWAESNSLAEGFANEQLAVLLNARGLFGGARVKKFADPQGPYPLPDPEITDRRRYQFHGELRLSTR